MRKQMLVIGQDMPMSDCPVDFDDLPSIFIDAINIFNLLSDNRVLNPNDGKLLFLGKDMHNFKELCAERGITDPVDITLVRNLLLIMCNIQYSKQSKKSD